MLPIDNYYKIIHADASSLDWVGILIQKLIRIALKKEGKIHRQQAT